MRMDGIVGIIQSTKLTMSEEELTDCVTMLTNELKHRRETNLMNIKSNIGRGTVVSFINNEGTRISGEVTKVKTKKALVLVGNTSWDVPIGRLSVCR